MNLSIMKNFLFIIVIVLFSCSSNKNEQVSGDIVNNPLSATNTRSSSLPVATFEKTQHDFGRIYQGEKLTYHFKFNNTGKADLLIASVSASCGCTVADFPKTPIAPGKGGSIAIEFNSAGRKGMQTKTATVLTNAQPSSIVLTISAMIIEP
jgi:hypothetical protein